MASIVALKWSKSTNTKQSINWSKIVEFSPTNALSEKKNKREKHPPGKALKKIAMS